MWCDFGTNLVQHFANSKTECVAPPRKRGNSQGAYQTVLLKLEEISYPLWVLSKLQHSHLWVLFFVVVGAFNERPWANGVRSYSKGRFNL